jgi:quercetin dioxygenase-like cupin family protein
MIFVLEGAFTVYTTTEAVTLTPGNHFFVPRNTPHVVTASSTPSTVP